LHIRSIGSRADSKSTIESVFDKDPNHRPRWFQLDEVVGEYVAREEQDQEEGGAKLKLDPLVMRAVLMRGSVEMFGVFKKNMDEVAKILDLDRIEMIEFCVS